MKRRDFIHRTACAAGAAWIHPAAIAERPLALPALSGKFSATDTVTLGKTGIQTSRLAMGTGTVGSGHHSHQTALGIKGLSDLLLNGYDHGCSCHSIEALRAAAKSPWVDVDLVRINPVGAYMDADPDTVLAVLLEMRAAGKGVVGMKILGQGELRHRQDEALRFALSLNLLDAFTIGAESQSEQEDLIRRIAAA